jgi:hypothetical protein
VRIPKMFTNIKKFKGPLYQIEKLRGMNKLIEQNEIAIQQREKIIRLLRGLNEKKGLYNN